MALKLKIGDVVRMKKAHPCGGHLWAVGRLGADIGITCKTSHHHLLLARTYLERRVREVLPRPIIDNENSQVN